MGTRLSYPAFSKNQCSFCGCTSWTGGWIGTELVLVCRDCATRILPVLIADATWFPAWTAATGACDLVKIEAAFWRAGALNIHLKTQFEQLEAQCIAGPWREAQIALSDQRCGKAVHGAAVEIKRLAQGGRIDRTYRHRLQDIKPANEGLATGLRSALGNLFIVCPGTGMPEAR